ncbi:MAG: IS630 transposase-related protein [Edaphobacter sp.]
MLEGVARAYSNDLREKVLGAYAAGKGTLRELSERFEVSYGWVKKIHAAELHTGDRRRVPQRRRPSGVDIERLKSLVTRKPDIVLRELQQEFAKAGQRFSMTQLWRVLKKLDLRLKKSRSTPPSVTRKPTGRGVKRSSSLSARSCRKT